METPIRFSCARNVVIVSVECDLTVCPAQMGSRSNDKRELGVLLSQILIDRAPLNESLFEPYRDSGDRLAFRSSDKEECGADGGARA